VNCDSIARWYRWLEYAGFGSELQRRRIAFLHNVTGARRVLVLGEGDGRFLARLVEQNLSSSTDYVDLSAQMLQLARERAGSDRVVYHHASALTIPLAESEYDLVCTHFFLDCLNQNDTERMVDRIVRAMAPGGRWLISEFREPNWWTRAVVRGLYFFFRLTTSLATQQLVDHHPLLERAGFRLECSETSRFGLLVSELWSKECRRDPVASARGSVPP
jgi:ubiquinone/menaquinone biosynthesis C-methylase UbiE